DDLRQEQQHADARGDDAKIVQREPKDLRVPERLPQADFAFGLDEPPFGFEVEISQLRSSPLSQCANCWRSVTQNNRKKPTSTVGIASAMNIHCQPARPHSPFSSRSAVDIGAPVATASGSATMKPDTMRARCQSGNQ